MERNLLTLIYKNIDSGKIGVSEKDAQRLDLEVGDICEFVDVDTDEVAVAKILVHPNIPEGTFISSEELASSIGADEGFQFEIRRYQGQLNTMLHKVSVGVGDAGIKPGLDIENIITKNQGDIQQFLSKRLIFKGLKMKVVDLGVILEVMGTEPDLKASEYAVCQEVVVELFPIVKSAFNGILLIDTSKSMEERDIAVDSRIHTALQQLHNMADEIMPNIKAFLDEFENKTIARRIDSAVLCAMLYFAEKVARGKGEKITIIAYSDTAEPIEFALGGNMMPWLDVSKGGLESRKEDVSMLLGANLLVKIKSMTAHHTNMGGAIEVAQRIAQKMGRYEKEVENVGEKPVMMVLLTDGEFDVGPSPVRTIKDKFQGRTKFVIHTVGIGDNIDEAVLKRMAQLGHGEYMHANDLNKLLEFYSTLAQKFKAIYKMEGDMGEVPEATIKQQFEKEVKQIEPPSAPKPAAPKPVEAASKTEAKAAEISLVGVKPSEAKPAQPQPDVKVKQPTRHKIHPTETTPPPSATASTRSYTGTKPMDSTAPASLDKEQEEVLPDLPSLDIPELEGTPTIAPVGEPTEPAPKNEGTVTAPITELEPVVDNEERIRELIRAVKRPQKKLQAQPSMSWAKLKEKAEEKRRQKKQEKKAKENKASEPIIDTIEPLPKANTTALEAHKPTPELQTTVPEVQGPTPEVAKTTPPMSLDEEKPSEPEPDPLEIKCHSHKDAYLQAVASYDKNQLQEKLEELDIEYKSKDDKQGLGEKLVDGLIDKQIGFVRAGNRSEVDPTSKEFGLALLALKKKKQDVGKGLAALIPRK